MGRVVIATPELSDSATIYSSSTASSMPATNLQIMQPGEPACFTTPSAAHVELDLGSAQAINLIWLGYTNASSTATWRIRAASTQSALTTSPGYDSGLMTHWPSSHASTWERTHALKWLGSSLQTYQWWRIDIADASNTEGVYRAGRLYLTNAFQPSNNAKYGVALSIIEQARRTESLGGEVHPRLAARRQAQDFTIEHLTKAEMLGVFYKYLRKRGVSQDILVILDPEETTYLLEYTVYGLLRDAGRIEIPTFNRYAVNVSIEEMP